MHQKQPPAKVAVAVLAGAGVAAGAAAALNAMTAATRKLENFSIILNIGLGRGSKTGYGNGVHI
jgi:outer membrane lipoprotein-sorting protein